MNVSFQIMRRKWAFSKIYRTGGWSGLGSGPGSQPHEAEPFLSMLRVIVANVKPLTILDVGCGEGLAIQALEQYSGNYMGVDIVGRLIRQNRRRYRAPNFSFCVSDLVAGAKCDSR